MALSFSLPHHPLLCPLQHPDPSLRPCQWLNLDMGNSFLTGLLALALLPYRLFPTQQLSESFKTTKPSEAPHTTQGKGCGIFSRLGESGCSPCASTLPRIIDFTPSDPTTVAPLPLLRPRRAPSCLGPLHLGFLPPGLLSSFILSWLDRLVIVLSCHLTEAAPQHQ